MANHTGKGCFRPGQSGNPGGRPAVSAEIRVLARERTPEAINILTEIMRDPKAPPAARVAACRELLDRGYGRPESSLNAKIETHSEQLDFSLLSPEERAAVTEFLDQVRPILEKAKVQKPNPPWQ